jgi:hypothetical protein
MRDASPGLKHWFSIPATAVSSHRDRRRRSCSRERVQQNCLLRNIRALNSVLPRRTRAIQSDPDVPSVERVHNQGTEQRRSTYIPAAPLLAPLFATPAMAQERRHEDGIRTRTYVANGRKIDSSVLKGRQHAALWICDLSIKSEFSLQEFKFNGACSF